MVKISNYAGFITAIQEHETCLVKIGAPWCGPCKVLQKNIEDIEEYHKDVYFIDVDVDEADEIVDKFDIRGVPVVLVIKNGKVDSRTVGLQTQADLEDRL